MKCMICGSKTLPGAKLCLPCRSALRRARDDTVSELLPLPRRLDALAYQHAHTVTGTPPRTSIAAKQKKARTTDAKQATPSARNLPQNAWQLAALAIAVLVLAILGGMLARQSHDAHAMDTLDPRPSAPVAVDTRVSPAALAAEARNSAAFPVSPTLTDVPVPPEPAPPEILRKDRPKPEKTRVLAPRPAPAAEMAPAFGSPIEETPSAAPVSKPDVASPPPDRWQLLSGRLSGCAGGNLFARVACEHAARAQYCEGHWGQVAQCPAGIANEHGQ
jgi:hypothetical protein